MQGVNFFTAAAVVGLSYKVTDKDQILSSTERDLRSRCKKESFWTCPSKETFSSAQLIAGFSSASSCWREIDWLRKRSKHNFPWWGITLDKTIAFRNTL